jgi:hypothetical protein
MKKILIRVLIGFLSIIGLLIVVTVTLILLKKDEPVQTVSIKNVSFKGSLVNFKNKPLSGVVYENYSNGSKYKSYNVENGIILDQTHFSVKGDTLAMMFYNEDGSYKYYTDKTLINNNIAFDVCKVMSSGDSGACMSSLNIPQANYRLARLYDFWVKSNNLIEAYASAAPTYPKGGARIGSVRGESKINITGITAKNYFQLKEGKSYKPKGPFTADVVFVSVRYGFNESNFNEEASLSWNSDQETKESGDVFTPSNIVMSANYKPNDGSSAGARFRVFLEEGGNFYVMHVSGANDNFIYTGEMEFSKEDLKTASDIFTGYHIIDPPGYDFNKFELYLNGDVKQGSVLSIRRNR